LIAVFLAISLPVSAAVVFRSAIPFGSASSWSSATGGDPNATQGVWLNSNDGLLYYHTATGSDLPLASPTCIAIAQFTGVEDSVFVSFTGLTATPIIFASDPIVTDAAGLAGSAPVISVNSPTTIGATVATSAHFTGFVTIYASNPPASLVNTAFGPGPSKIFYSLDDTLTPWPGTGWPTLAAINGTSAPFYNRAGRHGQAVTIPGTTGYYMRADPGYPAPASGTGWVWMAWVYAQSISGNQYVIDQEGLDLSSTQINGVRIYIDNTGAVNASIGASGSWAFTMTSTRTIGAYAWHHVAIAWDGTNAYLYVDGALDQTTPYALAPQSSATSPIAFGAQFGVGAGTSVLNGSIDEIKFYTYSVASGLGFILQEPWNAFRQVVYADLKTAGHITNSVAGDNSMNSPTRASTNILRAWVNSFITNARANLPVQQYVYTLNSAYPINGVILPAGVGVNSTYINLRDGITTGTCGVIAETLWGVFEGLGYMAHTYDTINNNDWNYDNSHVLNEVWITDVQKYFIQDATYNHNGIQVAGAVSPGTYNRITDIPYYSGVGPSLPWGNDGYNYNSDVRFPVPSLATYEAYFKNFVNIVPAWHGAAGE
jgi:hypothetical protein